MHIVESFRIYKEMASFNAMNEHFLYILSLSLYSPVISMLINHKCTLIFLSKYRVFVFLYVFFLETNNPYKLPCNNRAKINPSLFYGSFF
jgi:hypothetical protein